MRARLILPALALVLSLAGCATSPPPAPLAGWRAADVAAASAEAVVLRHEHSAFAPLRTERVRALLAVKEAVEQAAGGLRTELLILADAAPNAVVFSEDGQARMAVSLGMLELLGEDRDAFAALVGHELAHLYARHAEVRSQKARQRDDTGALVGLALSLVGVPLGEVLADAATVVVARGYDRDQEREADGMGMEYMARAGFDPAGAVRLYERLAALPAGNPIPFLGTHPSGPERVAAMRRLVGARAAAPEGER